VSSPDIFYVEDDTDFAFIMENAVQEVSNGLSIKIIENGKDALEALEQLTQAKAYQGSTWLKE
jgi:CheY-like chemotaxis protein